jgi:hypothetical protein
MRRFYALILIAASTTSCMSAPRPVTAPVAFIEVNRPAQIWVERKDGSTVLLQKPRIFADSLYGYPENSKEEIWMAINDARLFRVRQVDLTRTALLVGGLALVGGTALYLLAGRGPGIDQTEIDRPEMILIPRQR